MGEGQNEELQNTEQTKRGTTKCGLTKTWNDQNEDHTKKYGPCQNLTKIYIIINFILNY